MLPPSTLVAGSVLLALIFKFFLLVTVLSFAELYLLIQLAQELSVLATLALCVLTGVVGGAMVRSQGLSTLGRIQKSLGAAQLPSGEIISGLILLMIGTLLLTPGFITDTVAFAMLIPPLRRATAAYIGRRFKSNIVMAHRGKKSRPNESRSSNVHETNGFRRPEDVVIEVDAKES